MAFYDEDGREVDVEDLFDQMLDEHYYEMFGVYPSVTLYRADPIQYRCGVNDYVSSLIEDGILFENDPTLDDEESE